MSPAETLGSLGAVGGIIALVIGFMLFIAPLAIWSACSRTASLMQQQNRQLMEIKQLLAHHGEIHRQVASQYYPPRSPGM